jgi:hypothetical protein
VGVDGFQEGRSEPTDGDTRPSKLTAGVGAAERLNVGSTSSIESSSERGVKKVPTEEAAEAGVRAVGEGGAKTETGESSSPSASPEAKVTLRMGRKLAVERNMSGRS